MITYKCTIEKCTNRVIHEDDLCDNCLETLDKFVDWATAMGVNQSMENFMKYNPDADPEIWEHYE
jgi:hypothetical protein